jgi:hypothetical protein
MSKELFYQKQVMNPYPTESQSYTAYKKGFIEGWEKCQENQEALYTKEQVIEFTKWLASDWFALWVKDKFLWECDWSENAENQDYKGYYTEKQLLELFKSLKQK